MRNSDSTTIAALQAAPTAGLVPRQLVWIIAPKLSDGTLVGFGFWSEHLPVTMNVISGDDGSTVSRTYQGDGALLSVGNIKLTSDISIRTTSFVLSFLNSSVADLYANYRIKAAKVEIHRVPLDPVTRLLVAAPRPRFVGMVDGAPKSKPKPGGAGSLTIKCVSATVELTNINPAKRSDETQKRRSGDRHSRYADVVNQWQPYWGETGSS